MGYYGGFTSDTRFADTFLHPWEARLSIQQYYDLIGSSRLKPVALFDRYGELDDLKNPLWHMPTATELTERADDLRFENNLEIWLTHEQARPVDQMHVGKIPWNLRTKMPPVRWFEAEETRTLSLSTKMTLWHGWLATIFGHHHREAHGLIARLPRTTAQRLARLGAILPAQAEDCGRFQELSERRHASMDPPEVGKGALSAEAQIKLKKILFEVNPHCDERRVLQAMGRFLRVSV